MSEDWWNRRRRKRPYPWFEVFEEFDRIEEMMEKMMRRAFEAHPKGLRAPRPYVYGFSMSIGHDGKPVIREFGNVQANRLGPRIREEREPLVDVMDEEREVVIVAELPGVAKDGINLRTTEGHLTISVDTSKRKYYKELALPARVDPKSARASYKNGVLEVRLRKLFEKGLRGDRVSVE